MKRSKLIISIIAVMCILVLGATLLTGCKKAKLGTPEGFKYENGLFIWNEVEGADGYNVHVNSGTEFFVNTPWVSIDDSKISKKLVDKDVNTLWVMAVALDDEEKVAKSSELAKYEFDYMVPNERKWTVTFDLNYADAPQAQTISVASSEKFDKPANPQRIGWKFEGWYRDKICLVAASFTASGKNSFTVTADMTLYAKWTLDASITTTSIYFYNETWDTVAVKPYKGETELFAGEGVAMAAVASKANWYKADIDDTATSVIFTNGEESTQSAAFDKAKPYCKDGVWTATMPAEQPVEPEHGVYIKVGSGAPQQLAENPEVAGEYMITLNLEVGDTVVITIDGVTVSNYDPDCKFNGTATMQGKHTFYVSAAKIWVTQPKVEGEDPTPTPEYEVYIIINGDTANKVTLESAAPPDGVREQYSGTVTLALGDKVVVKDSNGKTFTWYQEDSPFRGTVINAGEHTFYVKLWEDGGDSMWVMAPKNTEVPTTSTKVYFHNSVAGKKLSEVYIYYWNYKTEQKEHNWPGVKMTSLGNDWYMFEIEAGYDMVIFNSGSGTQTADLDLEVVDGCAYYDFNGVTNDRPAE